MNKFVIDRLTHGSTMISYRRVEGRGNLRNNIEIHRITNKSNTVLIYIYKVSISEFIVLWTGRSICVRRVLEINGENRVICFFKNSYRRNTLNQPETVLDIEFDRSDIEMCYSFDRRDMFSICHNKFFSFKNRYASNYYRC